MNGLDWIGILAAAWGSGLAIRHWKKGTTEREQARQHLKDVEMQHQKLVLARQALQRLEDREGLADDFKKSQSTLSALDEHHGQFGGILLAIEQHLAFAEPEHAEEILITFARHLRNILHEGSTPFLSLKESLDHIRTYVQLMSMLTNDRFDCFIDSSADDPSLQGRLTESFLVTPWVEQWVWPMYELAERYPDRLPSLMISIKITGPDGQFSVHRPAEMGSEPWTQLTVPLLGHGDENEAA